MAEKDLTLQGDLDNKLVLKAIREMEQAADEMANSGDESFKRISESIKENVKVLRANREELLESGETYSVLFSEGKIGLEEFRKGITKLAADIKRVAQEAEGTQLGFDFEGIFKDVPKVELDEIIRTGRLLGKIDELKINIEILKNSTQDNAREMGAALEASFNALEKSGKIGADFEKSLNALVRDSNELTGSLEKVGETKLAEQLRIDLIGRQLSDIGQQAGKFLGAANVEVQKFGEDAIARANEIQDAFDRGQSSTKEYAAAVRELGTQLRENIARVADQDLTGLDEALNLSEAEQRLETIEPLIERLGNVTNSGLNQAAAQLNAKMTTLVALYEEGTISAEQLNKGMKEVASSANVLVNTMKGAADTDLSRSFKADLASKQLDDIAYKAEYLFDNSDDAMADLALGINARAEELRSLFDGGIINAKEYSGAVKELSRDFDALLKDQFKGEGVDIEEVFKLQEAEQAADRITALTVKLGQSLDAGAITAAGNLGDRMELAFDQFNRGIIEADDLNKKLKEIERSGNNIFNSLTKIGETDLATSLRADVASRNLDQIKKTAEDLGKSTNLTFSSLGQTISARATEIEDFYNRGQISADKYAQSIAALGTRLQQALSVEGAEALKPMDEALNLVETEALLQRIQPLISQLGNTINADAVSAADSLNMKIAELAELWRTGAISSEEFNSQLKGILGSAKDFVAQFKEAEELDLNEALNLIEAKQSMDSVKDAAKTLAESTDEAAKSAGEKLAQNANLIEDQYDRGAKSAEQYGKEVANLERQANRLAKRFEDVVSIDFSKSINVDLVRARVLRVQDVINQLVNSTDTAAQRAGNNIQSAADKLLDAFEKDRISAEELNKELSKLESKGKEIGRTYGEDVATATDKSTISIWKMGNALDRVGIRGAGGALRVLDAVKGLHPALIAAAAAAAGVIVVMKKLGEIAVEALKKISKATVDLIKDSVALAEQYETVELQLRNIFRGKVELARETMQRIVQLSARLGVDLTDRIAYTFLPLVDSFEMFERIGEIAATFAVKTGKSMDEVSRALQQGVAGQFRSLEYQFGVTGDQVEHIKELQEELGDTEGLIQGLEDYFDVSGTGWDTYEDTLRRAKGQLEQTFNLFKLALGEPIKIELVEQLAGIRKWIDDHKYEIENFFRDLGKAIGQVVGDIGEVINNILQSIDAEDLDDISLKVQEIADNISIFLEGLKDADFSFILDGLMLALDFVNRLVSNTQSWLALFRAGLTAIDVEGSPQDALEFGAAGFAGGPLGVLGLIQQRLAKNIVGAVTGTDDSLAEAQEIINTRKEEIETVRELREEYERKREAARKASQESKEESEEEADAMFKLNVLIQERTRLMGEVSDAAAEISAEIADFNKEMERAFRDIFIEEGRRQLDDRIDNARKRLDLERQYQIELKNIRTGTMQDEEDQAIDHERELEDIFIEYGRKEIEIEIEESKKKEELLEKHLNKLKEIREKFDLDAEEAIRQNDAVALLRIRRRMELELRQENRRYEQQVEDAAEAAQEKREELDKWLQYEIEDQERADERKLEDIKRTHTREIEAEKEKYAEQLEQQRIAEERKRADLQLWLDREVEDFNQAWRDKNEDLQDQMDDAIDIYETGIDRILEINMEIAQLMASGFVSANSFLGQMGGIIPGIPGGGSFGIGGGTGGIGGLIGGNGFNPNQASIQTLRSLAHSLAFGLNRPQITHEIIDDADYDELVELVLDMQKQQYGSGRARGGIVNPNMVYPNVVGEEGPEPIYPIQHGIVAPHDPLMMSPQSQQAATISNDYSRNVTADISMLDPTHLTEVQKTLIRAVFTEQLLRLDD